MHREAERQVFPPQVQSLVKAKSALEAATEGRDIGRRTEQDVSGAQQRQYAAELELVRGRAD